MGPGHLPAPPWGSVYTDHECVIFGEATLALRALDARLRHRAHHRRAHARNAHRAHAGLLSFLAVERPELVDDFLRDHLLLGRRTIWIRWRRPRPILR
ncbi:MAG: hypothetical protein ACLUW6_03065 [Coriobacteriaceae bacterium]